MSKYKDQKIFSKIFKLILINFSILFILLIILEFITRTAIGIYNCINKSCDFTLIKSIIIKDDFVSKNLEISEIDEVYGYKLSKNFDKIIEFINKNISNAFFFNKFRLKCKNLKWNGELKIIKYLHNFTY